MVGRRPSGRIRPGNLFGDRSFLAVLAWRWRPSRSVSAHAMQEQPQANCAGPAQLSRCYGCFPPAYIADKQGRPMHSWRTLLLPFCEFKPIYREYRFDEPWDGPHNRELAALKLNLFQCPETQHSNSETNYLVVVGPKTVFPGSKCVKISEITAGTTETVLIVEVDNSGNSVEPSRAICPRSRRPAASIRKSGIGISSRHKWGGAQIAFANGSVRFLPSDYPPDDLPALFDRDAKPKPPLPNELNVLALRSCVGLLRLTRQLRRHSPSRILSP